MPSDKTTPMCEECGAAADADCPRTLPCVSPEGMAAAREWVAVMTAHDRRRAELNAEGIYYEH